MWFFCGRSAGVSADQPQAEERRGGFGWQQAVTGRLGVACVTVLEEVDYTAS